MFGGNAVDKDQDVDADQTWQWSGSNWAQLTPPANPPGGECAMTYDAARKVIVLVTDNVTARAQETWTWDGTNWINDGVVPFLGFKHQRGL